MGERPGDRCVPGEACLGRGEDKGDADDTSVTTCPSSDIRVESVSSPLPLQSQYGKQGECSLDVEIWLCGLETAAYLLAHPFVTADPGGHARCAGLDTETFKVVNGCRARRSQVRVWRVVVAWRRQRVFVDPSLARLRRRAFVRVDCILVQFTQCRVLVDAVEGTKLVSNEWASSCRQRVDGRHRCGRQSAEHSTLQRCGKMT